MSFIYNPGIPAQNNDPADDQPDMQTNFASINSIMAVDHVSFNDSNGGLHKEVTFASNNVPPGPTTTPPVLFTNIVGSLSQLFFYSGNTASAAAQYVSSGNGSTSLMGGMILKWGNGLAPAGTSGISFASAFPTNCFLVIAVSNDPAAPTAANTYIYASGWTVAGFNITAVRRISLAANGSSYSYIAIGN